MIIPVIGFDPSLTHWGIAESQLDLETGFLDIVNLSIVKTEKGKEKQVRKASDDLQRAEDIASVIIPLVQRNKVVFTEVPSGSQSAAAMKAYGLVLGILACVRALGIPLIEVSPLEVKKSFTGNKNATKDDMIVKAVELYPEANFPRCRGRITDSAEHVADAIAAIHAGVDTPLFKSLIRLLEKV